MKLDDCYQLGEVIKTHALKGEVSIMLDVDSPDDYKELESVFLLREGKLVPFFIDTIQVNGNKALIKFEDVDTIESASELVKSEIYLPLANLPELPNGAYYFHDLLGCDVYEDSNHIGIVQNVIDLSANQLLSIAKEEKEILVPLKDEIIKLVDSRNKRIDVALPAGLLDLYKE